MKKESFQCLAMDLGLSKSTVSRAARHCSSVDYETRMLVLEEMKKNNINPESNCDVYCILPDIPHYFWDGLHNGIVENIPTELNLKMNITAQTIDEQVILAYLDEAKAMHTSVIIIAAFITKAIEEKLNDMLPNTLIIHLCEYHNMPNTFYIGADSFGDGYNMGTLFCQKFSQRKLLLLSKTEDYNSNKRYEGFKKALDENNSLDNIPVLSLNNKYLNDKTAASRLAAILSPYAHKVSCIYSPTGNPYLSLALQKAGFPQDTLILSHDENLTPAFRKSFSVVCNQDVYNQGKAAILAAETFVRCRKFPKTKYSYFPSTIYCNDSVK